MFLKHQVKIYEWFLENHETQKATVLESQFKLLFFFQLW